MKTFLRQISLYALLLASVLALAVLFVTRGHGTKEHFLAEARAGKRQLLEQHPSPRAVLVAGSSLFLSVNSPRLADSLGMPVINYALHAGIGWRFMVDDIASEVRPGDIVVFAPEYQQFYGLRNGEAVTLAPLVLYSRPPLFKQLSAGGWMTVAKGLGSVLLKGIKHTKTDYTVDNVMNECGDEILHWNETFEGQPDLPVPIRRDIDKPLVRYFFKKMEEMEKKGCRVVLLPPVIIQSGYDILGGKPQELARYFELEGRPYVVEPEAHVLPDSLAYDTYYHMNRAGVEVFTSKLISVLK